MLVRTILRFVIVIGAVTSAAASAAALTSTAQEIERAIDAKAEYESAGAAALAGDLELAEEHLRAAVRAGFRDFSAMRRDLPLAPLRERDVLRAILAARDAADDSLAQRRIDEWMARLDPSHYSFERDRASHIDLIAPAAAESLPLIDAILDDLAHSPFPAQPAHRTTVILLNDDDAAVFLPRANARGRYLHSQNLLLASDDDRALRHELAHVLHHAHMDSLGQEHAMWVQEGLASLFESLAVRDGSRTIHRNERDSIIEMMIAGNRALPWRDLFAMSQEVFERDAGSTYAQARSIFRFLDERDVWHAWYESYCESFLTDPTGALALETVTNQPLESLEDEWREWVRAGTVSITPIAVVSHGSQPLAAKHSPAPKASHPLPEDSGAQEQAHEGEAAALYARIRPQELRDYSAAAPYLENVIALDPSHAAARYDLALAFIMNGDLAGANAQCAALERLDRNLASLLRALLIDSEH